MYIDIPIKIFFQKLKKHKINQNITEVKTENGHIENNQKTILNIAHKYYENLYKETKVKDKDILNKFLEQLPKLENDDSYKKDLIKPGTFEKLKDVINSFKNGKFYKKTHLE